MSSFGRANMEAIVDLHARHFGLVRMFFKIASRYPGRRDVAYVSLTVKPLVIQCSAKPAAKIKRRAEMH